jgi:restriction system protein
MRPADAIALFNTFLADGSSSGLPSALLQAVRKLLTASNLHSRGLDVTTHWTSPSQSCLRWEPAALNNKKATIGPVKAGWLVKSKGHWYVTEEGKKAYNQILDPEEFNREARRLYLQWRAAQPDAIAGLEEVAQEGTTSIENAAEAGTVEEAEETAWAEIERYVQGMNPYDLQKLVAALLRAMGYHVSWNAPPGPDKGIDIIAHNDPLGTSSPRIKVQVKRRADKISVDGLRAFIAILAEQDVGIFVSTGGFTSEAESEARTKETRKLTLVNLEQLVDLWVEHYDKVAESEKLLLPLSPSTTSHPLIE